jgi:hypothetical protein
MIETIIITCYLSLGVLFTMIAEQHHDIPRFIILAFTWPVWVIAGVVIARKENKK